MGMEKRGGMLESKVREESEKFKNSEIGSIRGLKLQNSLVEAMKTSSVRGMSDNKRKPVLNLGESIYSASLNTQLVSPQADSFNKEIMLKLLNIIEKDRTNPKTYDNYHQHPREHSDSKEQRAPIIINNIVKTPAETMDRDLVQREMKIRMLEDHRNSMLASKELASRVSNKPRLAVSESINAEESNN